MHRRRWLRLVSVVLPAFLLVGLASHAQPTTELIVLSGDAAPDNNGTFLSFFDTALNDAGQVAFEASLINTTGGFNIDDSGVFRGSALLNPIQLARRGSAAPDGNGTYAVLGNPVINSAGRVAFPSTFRDTANGFDDDGGMFITAAAPGTSGVLQLVREGDNAPDGNGTYRSLRFATLNTSDQAAFMAVYDDTADGIDDNTGLVRLTPGSPGTPGNPGNPGTVVSQIAREDQSPLGGIGTFKTFYANIDLNDAGQVAFRADLRNTPQGSTDNGGLFLGTGTGSPAAIVRKGAPVPEGNGTFVNFGAFNLNDTGQVAFAGSLTGTSGSSADNTGLYLASSGALTKIARKGDTAPNSAATIQTLGPALLNATGQVAFRADLASGGSAVYRYETDATYTDILSASQATPDGNGQFGLIPKMHFNNAGQLAMLANLTGTAGGNADNTGLYFHDDTLGLLTVAREGDAFLGSTLAGLDLTAGLVYGDEANAFNNAGQIAFNFNLTDGRRGIALWTPQLTALTLAGDFGGDGQVEQADLDLVLQNWGLDTNTAGLPAGWTHDNLNLGQIEQTELDRVLQNWGSTTSPNFRGTNLPEPTTPAWLALAGLASLNFRATRPSWKSCAPPDSPKLLPPRQA